MDCSVGLTKKLKKFKKARQVATPPPPYTPKAACIHFGLWGRVLDVINHAKFQLDRYRGFGAPGGRISLSPIDRRYRPYNSVRTNVLHCDKQKCTLALLFWTTWYMLFRFYCEIQLDITNVIAEFSGLVNFIRKSFGNL